MERKGTTTIKSDRYQISEEALVEKLDATCAYLKKENIVKIHEAYQFAKKAHVVKKESPTPLTLHTL